MRRRMPSLALLGLVLVGCGGESGPNKQAGPDAPEVASTSLHHATIEVRGMT